MLRNLGTLVLMLLLATPLAAVAQNTGKLSGRVVDDLGDPLPGANVILEGTQLGAATDIDGNYFIIGIPVGDYDVTASFVGYQTQTVTGVQISTGYTTEQNFELGPQELGEVTVTYERPIIQKDAIGAPRVVSGEDIQNLPIRGVADLAAIQTGVVNSGRDDALFVRGGREQEIAYYVDGVKVTGSAPVGVNQAAIAEQEMLIGTIPARYGDVQSGVISITTKSGGTDFFGSAEVVTSEVLDDFGYNLGALSIGGPIVPGRVNFFLSGQGTFEADYNTYSVDTYRLSDEDFAFLQQNPQVLRLRNGAGESEYIPFPADLLVNGDVDPSDLEGLTNFLAEQGLIDQSLLDEGFVISSADPFSAPETYTAERFDLARGKDAPRQNYTFNGNVTLNLTEALSLRLGGGYVRSATEEFTYANSLYNRNYFYNDERDSYRVYGTFRQRLADNAFYQIQGEYQDYRSVQYPEGFSSNVEDVLSYGDVDHPANEVWSRYYILRSDGYQQLYATDGGQRPTSVGGIAFSLPGASLTRFQKSHDQQLRFSGSATTQLGVHQIEFGGEYQQETRRFIDISGHTLAGRVADEDGVNVGSGLPLDENGNPIGVTSYDQLPFEVMEGATVDRYGYNYLGTEEVDDQNIDEYFAGTNTNVAPYKPIYYAGYIQDKIEFRDLVINLGLRVDVFDNNTTVLFDPYAPTAIVRASDLEGLPGNIGSDWAVYFNDSGDVVGYRDRDGGFYDTEGVSTTSDEIAGGLSGQVERARDAEGNFLPASAAFTDYEPQVTVMPRVGVSFPVTDRALFFASYNVTSQRPTERAFDPFWAFEFGNITGQTRTNNPSLEPEQTTQYELGFRQRVGERAAFTLSGFYRTQENKISARNLFGGLPEYSTYVNTDFTTSKGVEVGFDLRRTNNLSINANYTLAFASGTGSDATSTGTAAWRGNFFPNAIHSSDFDQRHTANLSLDYRFGADEGPMLGGARILENFGVNVLASFGSGQRYTPLVRPEFDINASFTSDTRGYINSATLPATSRIDLRIDRGFDLGFQSARLKAYLWVQNLFDTENVLAVYRATGLPDEDGFLESPFGQPSLNNALDPAGYGFNYDAYTGGPVNVGGSQSSGGGFFYGPPRRIRLGLLLDF